MSDNIENLVLEMLRALRNEVQAMRTEMHTEFRDVKLRLSRMEHGQAKNHAEYADLYGDHARQQSVIDQLAERIERLERRLEIGG